MGKVIKFVSSNKKVFIPLLVVLGLGIAPFLLYAIGWVIQFLWNSTITEIFNTAPMGVWQGLFLLILCKILFSNEYSVKVDSSNEKKC